MKTFIKKSFLVYYLLICCFFFCGFKDFEIDAENTTFDGKFLIFSGNVFYEDSLGVLKADQVKVTLPEIGQNISISEIHVEGNISIRLTENSFLSCDYISVFPKKYCAHITSLKGKTALFKTVYDAKPLTVYAEEISLFGDASFFNKNPSLQSLQHIICKGSFSLTSQDKVAIKSDFAQIEKRDAFSYITLKKDVFIDWKKLVIVETQDKIEIQQQADSEDFCNFIKCFGKTKITFQRDSCYHIETDGLIHFDVEKEQVFISSSKEKRVKLWDDKGKVYADKIFLFLKKKDQKFLLQKVVMEGNVYIENQNIDFQDNSTKSSPKQHVLADKVVYDLSTDNIQLFSGKFKKVLLIDEINQATLSADALSMIYDHKTGFKSVRGIGDVNIQLKKDELKRLKQMIEKHEKK